MFTNQTIGDRIASALVDAIDQVGVDDAEAITWATSAKPSIPPTSGLLLQCFTEQIAPAAVASGLYDVGLTMWLISLAQDAAAFDGVSLAPLVRIYDAASAVDGLALGAAARGVFALGSSTEYHAWSIPATATIKITTEKEA